MLKKPVILSNGEIEEVTFKTMEGWTSGTPEEDDITIPQAIAQKQLDNDWKEMLGQIKGELNDITCMSDAGDRDKALTSLIYGLQSQLEEARGKYELA